MIPARFRDLLFRKSVSSRPARRRRSRRSSLCVESLERRSLLTTFTVTSLADSGAGTLRQAIDDANNNDNGFEYDEIAFDLPSGSTISLTSGDIAITETVAILGPGETELTIDAGGNSRVFDIIEQPETFLGVDIFGVTLTGGSEVDGGAIRNIFGSVYIAESTLTGNSASRGGAIYTEGDSLGYGGPLASLYLDDVEISGNSADDGGGIYNNLDHVELYNGSVVSGNSATNDGGGIYTLGQGGGVVLGTLFVYEGSQVSNNVAGNNGGGIYNENDHVELWDGSLISGNVAGNAGGGVYTFADGFNGPGETLYVSDSQITGNTAVHGGGIYNSGDYVSLFRSSVDGNQATGTDGTGSADGLGGGIYSESNELGYGSVDLYQSTVANNVAQAGTGVTGAPGVGQGGGVYAGSGALYTYQSTLSGNQALRRADGQGEGEGGGLWSSADYMSAENSTFSGNSAEDAGGGIYTGTAVEASYWLSFVTITNNTAADGGGIFHDESATLTIDGSIVAGNSSNDITGAFSGTSNLIGVDPLLGPLQDNFGPTQTHALLPGSPAIDASTLSRFEDQRDLRVFGTSDIGAFEVVLDFGDAPASFPVTLADDGARHEVSGLYLGSSVDSEADGQVSNAGFANADDDNGFPDDEDGVTFVAAVGGFSGRVEVVASGNGFLSGWIDADGNGVWDATEQVINDVAVAAGVNIIDFNLPGPPILEGISAIARFRLSSTGGLAPTGAATDGEVEDYSLQIDPIVLPDGTTGGYTFTTVTPPRVRRWYDPEVAVGYDYEVNPGGDNFTSVEFVSGFGDDLYTVEFVDGTGTAQVVVVGPFDPFDFETEGNSPGGVSFFRVTGIEPEAGLDPDDPAAFPTGLAFGDADNNGEAVVDFTMTPLATPVAVDDAYEVDEDNVLNTNISESSVLDNDTDRNEDELTASVVSGPSHGTLEFNDNGTFVYTPDENFNGTDSFTYVANDGLGDSDPAAVTITVHPVNDVPVAAPDDATTDEDTSVVIDVLANDFDVDGDDLTVDPQEGPSNGTIVINEDGTITYTPDENFNGEDSFTYLIGDGQAVSEVVTVTITVNPVNDAPVAGDDESETDEDTSVVIDLLANDNDVDGDELTVGITGGPVNGTLTENEDGTFTYTPAENYFGTDTITYTVTDGELLSNEATVTITVNPVNDAPEAFDDAAETEEDAPVNIDVNDNDLDVENDILSPVIVTQPANGSVVVEEDGTLTYTPNPDFNGTDTFTYAASDGELESEPATVAVTVNSVNDAPVAESDTAETDENTPVDIAVLGNDSDVDGDDLTPSVVTAPANGTATVNEDGSITYTPNEGFTGTDTFTYVASDGTDDSNEATVTITVNAVNNTPPEAADDEADVEEGSSVVIGVLVNDFDADGDNLTPVIVTGPANGTATVNEDGSITYTPNEGFTGTDTFTYVANDGTADSNEATVTITVSAAPGGPTVEEIPDPLDPSRNALLVTGTSENDVIFFQRRRGGAIRVIVNGENLGTFNNIDVVIAEGLGGNDRIIVDDSLIVDARLYGNEGNDRLYAGLAGINILDGGPGNDRLYASPFGSTVMVGGEGNDELNGGFLSRDILIGGTGVDRLYGGLLSESILIGGTTTYDDDAVALSAIQAEWAFGGRFSSRIRNLTNGGGLNGDNILAIGDTVHEDDARDQLFGGLLSDWFFDLDRDRLRNVWFNDYVSR
ncbi:MAG: Ig-like domain-containing protein [Planctomycetaceae bacterium]